MSTFIKNMILLVFLVYISAQMAKAAETRRMVVVIDSGLSFYQSQQDYICGMETTVGGSVFDSHGHGTNVISIIAERINSKTHCIYSIKGFDPKTSRVDTDSALVRAYQLNPAYVNLSFGGQNVQPVEVLYVFLMTNKGTVFSVASGNDKSDLDKDCYYYPACIKPYLSKKQNFHVIGASDVEVGNTGKIVTRYLSGKDMGSPRMSGTSQATALNTALLIQKEIPCLSPENYKK